MPLQTLKAPAKTAAAADPAARDAATQIIAAVRSDGETAVRNFAKQFDNWTGDIVVPPETLQAAADKIPPQAKADILLARDQVRKFAQAQMQSLRECEVELLPGLRAGHRRIPMTTAGCYIPGGRYAHAASAVMSVATAREAGVPNIVACSPPRAERGGIHPAILFALHACGADVVLNLGGAHAIAALAAGLFSQKPADILVGPGSAVVAEAKRIFSAEGVAIDMFAGPTEILIIADQNADPEIVAADLVGQAEHGPTSPAWLIALSQTVAEKVNARVPELIAELPRPNRDAALAAWRDFGEILVANSREEAAARSDEYAAEHLEIHCADPDWWLENLRNYGSIFLGEECTVAFGDKVSGPNHILPTAGAARRTGGLSVAKFLKTATWQRMNRGACRPIAAAAARISRLEGMEAHARTADARLAKYFPGESFNLHPEAESVSDSESDSDSDANTNTDSNTKGD